MLEVNFAGSADTRIQLYSYDGSTFTQLANQDDDNLDNNGERMTYTVSAAGTYYVLPRTYDASLASLTLQVNKGTVDDALTVAQTLAGATAVTSFPFQADFQLGGTTGDKLLESGYYYGVKAYKLALTVDQTIGMNFQSGVGDAVVVVYDSAGTKVRAYDNYYEDGGMLTFTASVDDTYTFLLLDEYRLTAQNCSVTIQNLGNPQALTDFLAAATSLTSLPQSETITLGQSTAVQPDTNINEWVFYGKAYQVTLTDTQALSIDFAGKSAQMDTIIAIYRETFGSYQLVNAYDNDNLNGDGEKTIFSPGVAGTYYVVLRGYAFETGDTDLALSMRVMSDGLDFTTDPAPIPGSDDLWSWDAATKTLTLKNGFEILVGNEAAIELPDGATLVVEGAATLESAVDSDGEDGVLYCAGSLVIDMRDGAVLQFHSWNDDGIYAENDLEIKGPVNAAVKPMVKGFVEHDTLNTEEGDMVLTNCNFDLQSDSDGIYVDENLTATDCSIKIRCYDQGVDADNADSSNGLATFTNCTLDIESESDQAIEADNLSLINCQSNLRAPKDDCIECNGNGNFICTGGTLVATARDNVIDAEGTITLNDVKLYLESKGEPVLLWYGGENMVMATNDAINDAAGYAPIAINTAFRLYQGDECIYEGNLTEALFANQPFLVTEDEKVANKLVSFYAVTFYDEDGTTVLKETQYVDYGAAAEAPEDPTKPEKNSYRYTFKGWDTAFDNVTTNLEIKATYEATYVKPATPSTGDASMLWLPIVLMALSAAAGVGLRVAARRR